VGPTFTRPELDDRREVWLLLGRLRPSQRVSWLRWCCREASAGQPNPIEVSDSDGSVEAVYWDFVSVLNQGRLTLARAGERLARLVNQR
jgi:hypothetical protein